MRPIPRGLSLTPSRTATPWRARRRRRPSPAELVELRRGTLLLVLWGVTAACAYFASLSAPGLANAGIAWILVGALAAGNALIGRADAEKILRSSTAIAIAVVYTVAIFATWYLGGQGSVELMVGAIAILDLALVGLTLTELGAISLAMAVSYAIMN